MLNRFRRLAFDRGDCKGSNFYPFLVLLLVVIVGVDVLLLLLFLLATAPLPPFPALGLRLLIPSREHHHRAHGRKRRRRSSNRRATMTTLARRRKPMGRTRRRPVVRCSPRRVVVSRVAKVGHTRSKRRKMHSGMHRQNYHRRTPARGV